MLENYINHIVKTGDNQKFNIQADAEFQDKLDSLNQLRFTTIQHQDKKYNIQNKNLDKRKEPHDLKQNILFPGHKKVKLNLDYAIDTPKADSQSTSNTYLQ
eukprot:4512119-Heterocapsa_arctica.AAC.1